MSMASTPGPSEAPRLSRRRAWLLWACSPQLAFMPLQAFYLGRIRQGVRRTAGIMGAVTFFLASFIGFGIVSNRLPETMAATEGHQTHNAYGAMLALFLLAGGLLLLVLVVSCLAWLLDAARMDQRLWEAEGPSSSAPGQRRA